MNIKIVTSKPTTDDLERIVEFHNANLPDSKHTREFKSEIYRNVQASARVVRAYDGDKLIGLLEAWVSGGLSILGVLAVDEDYRRHGIATKMFANLDMPRPIIVHFREKKKLEEFYKKLGFSNARIVGQYNNGDNKVRMEHA